MRFLRYVAATIITTLCFVLPVRGLEATPPAPLLPQSPLVISAYSFDQTGLPNYVEIYNNSSTALPVHEWSIAFAWGERPGATTVTAPYSLQLSSEAGMYVAPGSYTVVSFDDMVAGAHVQVRGITVQPSNYIARVSLHHAAYRPYERTMAASVQQVPMRLNRGATGYTSTYGAEDRTSLSVTDWHEPRESTPLRIVEIFPNAQVCSPFEQGPLCSDYIKLYNDSDQPVDLSKFLVKTSGSSAAGVMTGLLPGHGYVVVAMNLSNSSSWVWIEDVYGLVRHEQTLVQYADGSSRRAQAWSYDDASLQWRWSAYPTPYDAPNQFTDGSPVNDCSELRLSEIAANTSTQFIEIYNSGDEAVSMRGCQLLTNRSQDARYVFADVTLPSGAYAVVHIADTELTLTKTTTGTVYLLSSDAQVEVDVRSYENLGENTSFSLIDGVWLQTFEVTPGSANRYQEFLPCQSGYLRNSETGRCNKIAVATALADCGPGKYRNEETGRCRNEEAAATLTPCRPDQYRSPETNRCRSIATTSSTLTPCKPGQERNQETNRCRSTASTASTLKPCAAGQERNPATNRCRKVTAQGDAAAGFKVSDAATSRDRIASWLALGGVGIAALSYAAWEWRREVFGLFAKITNVLPGGK